MRNWSAFGRDNTAFNGKIQDAIRHFTEGVTQKSIYASKNCCKF